LVESTDGIAFRHEHVRRAAAADLLPRLRHRHHLALAAGLAAHPGDAATHWIAAHVPDRAFAAAVDAAGRAEAAHAPEDAIELLELALALVDRSAPGGGDPPARKGAKTATAADTARTAAASTRAAADAIREVATPLQLRAAESAFAAGRPARAVAYLEALLGSFDERT